MRTHTGTVFGVVASALLTTACSDPSGPNELKTPSGPQASRIPRGIDREFVQVARAVPGFGGLSRAPDGSAILYLTDPSQAAAAKQALTTRSRVLPGIDLARIQVRTAQFDFIRLADWRTRIREGLDNPGVVLLDIDESTNHVRIGVVPGTSHDLIESEVARLGVPADAFSVEDADPVRFTATLRDRIRPTRGGIQIAFNSADLPPGFFFVLHAGRQRPPAGDVGHLRRHELALQWEGGWSAAHRDLSANARSRKPDRAGATRSGLLCRRMLPASPLPLQ